MTNKEQYLINTMPYKAIQHPEVKAMEASEVESKLNVRTVYPESKENYKPVMLFNDEERQKLADDYKKIN